MFYNGLNFFLSSFSLVNVFMLQRVFLSFTLYRFFIEFFFFYHIDETSRNMGVYKIYYFVIFRILIIIIF